MAVADSPFTNGLRVVLEYLGLGDRIAPFPVRRLARPWTDDELPVPEGFEVRPPDYVGIGTQKSGTSWWASLIEAHPDVSPNRFGRKEMHYLTHFFEQPLTAEAIRTYHRAFARPRGRRCGEWTPNYMASPYTAALLAKVAPEAKVLVMVRNPIRRYESGFNHEYRHRFGAVCGPGTRMKVIKGYALRKESIWNGMYGVQMEIVLRSIPRERVLLLQYERCRANPGEMIARTYRFLGLDDSYVPEGLDREVNVQKRVVEPLGPEARGLLREVYAADVERLSSMFPESIDLGLWPEFAGRPAEAAA